jgi:hypothetical protein
MRREALIFFNVSIRREDRLTKEAEGKRERKRKKALGHMQTSSYECGRKW